MAEHEPSTYTPRTGVERFLDSRLPLPRLMWDSFVTYPIPRNLNYWYTFGGILAVVLVSQILTGIVLAMHYTASVNGAFQSVEFIMRDVNSGWLLRYMHAVGASMFFLAVYIHMARGLYYGSYKEPREVLWILGVLLYILMMATAFMGYVLPWGQMSYWGATVITGFFTAFPFIGVPIQEWLLGGFAVGNPTLNRFFALHYLLPFVTAGVVVLHVWALHVVGQTNPTGVPIKTKADAVPFTPHATIKDSLSLVLFFLLFAYFVFYHPNYLGHADNYTQADPMVTPAHIVPEWYFLPFYAILRAVTFDIGPISSKLGGVLAMLSAVLILFFVPWLDTSKVRSAIYRPLYKQFYWIFVATVIALGWLGAKPAEGGYILAAQVLTAWYFIHFLVVLPLLGLIETPLPRPPSIAESVLGPRAGVQPAPRTGGAAHPVGAPAAPETRG